MMLAGRPLATTRFAAFAVTHAAVPPSAIEPARRGLRAARATTAAAGTAPNVPYCIAVQTAGNAAFGSVLADLNISISVSDRVRRASAAEPARTPKPSANPATLRADAVVGVTVVVSGAGRPPSLGLFERRDCDSVTTVARRSKGAGVAGRLVHDDARRVREADQVEGPLDVARRVLDDEGAAVGPAHEVDERPDADAVDEAHIGE